MRRAAPAPLHAGVQQAAGSAYQKQEVEYKSQVRLCCHTDSVYVACCVEQIACQLCHDLHRQYWDSSQQSCICRQQNMALHLRPSPGPKVTSYPTLLPATVAGPAQGAGHCYAR